METWKEDPEIVAVKTTRIGTLRSEDGDGSENIA